MPQQAPLHHSTKSSSSSSTGRVRRPQKATTRPVASTTETYQGQQRSIGSADPIQEEIRRMLAEYRNTPPLFVTATRDFFVDVARYPLGFKLTTMQAIDSEGDQIQYSLKPANYRDASPYFSINSTTGELRLANKRIPILHQSSPVVGAGRANRTTLARAAHLPSGADTDDATGSGGGTGEEDEGDGGDDDDDDDNYRNNNSTTRVPEANSDGAGEGGGSGQLVRSVAELQQPDSGDSGGEHEKPGYLYFLNVAANDGKYTSVVELQIHVFNSTSFGTKSPVQLTIEGGRRTSEQLMHAKTAEFFDKLYSAETAPSTLHELNNNNHQHSHQYPVGSDNSTLVFPSFVNPSLIAPNGQPDADATTESNKEAADAIEPEAPTRTIKSPINSSLTTEETMTKEELARANQLASLTSSKLSPSPIMSLPLGSSSSSSSSISANNNNLGHADMLNQPMMLSMVIIICSCFTIALVLLVFVVPLSVRRLKKRLKNVERQHEQLSEKPSNGGGSSIVCSNASSTSGRSMTISSTSGGSRHCLPSTLSQFTLASSDRSCAATAAMLRESMSSDQHHQHQQRLQIGRQSSLDSAITSGLFSSHALSPASASSYNSQSAQYQQQQHQQAAANMRHLEGLLGDTNFAVHQQQQQHHNDHHHHHHHLWQPQRTPPAPPLATNGLNRVNNGAIANPVYLHHQCQPNDGAAPDLRAQQLPLTDGDNIYCPIDEEYYFTINTEVTTINESDNCAQPVGAINSQQQLQQPGMIGSLMGETFDSRNYFAAQCAPQQRESNNVTASVAVDQRDTDTPNSISSHSSTRSLTRFLSLPARHLSHQLQQQQEKPHLEQKADCGDDDRVKRKQASSFLDELECNFFTTRTGIEEVTTEALAPMRNDNDDAGGNSRAGANHRAAQTIARTNRIEQEHQVGKTSKSNTNNGNIKRHKSLVNTAQSIEKHQRQHQKQEPHVWELARHRLKFLNQIDKGQFGLVWRCKLKTMVGDSGGQLANDWTTLSRGTTTTERTVAVKMLKRFSGRDEREQFATLCNDLLAEIEIMKLVCNHPNVVKILHCCTKDISQSNPIYLVMEHVELGKLQSFLKKSRSSHNYATVPMASGSLFNGASQTMATHQRPSMTAADAYYCDDESSTTTTVYDDAMAGQRRGPMMQMSQTDSRHEQLTSRELIKFIYHVANGMEYISSKLIVHRDLASRNILVSLQRVCKVGDFGMARQIDGQEAVYECHSRNTKVPVRWMAPEALLNNSFTTKSDVYSFGILMWEIVTLGSTPYMHLETGEIVKAVARLGERPSRPDYCHALLYNIMSRCWSPDPDERPSFTQLVRELDELLLSTNEYIELDQYPDNNYYNIPQAAAPLELL